MLALLFQSHKGMTHVLLDTQEDWEAVAKQCLVLFHSKYPICSSPCLPQRSKQYMSRLPCQVKHEQCNNLPHLLNFWGEEPDLLTSNHVLLANSVWGRGVESGFPALPLPPSVVVGKSLHVSKSCFLVLKTEAAVIYTLWNYFEDQFLYP